MLIPVNNDKIGAVIISVCEVFCKLEIIPPKHVREILNRLASAGYTACIVGGCVRDAILGVVPNDWDIASSALPEEVLELFPDSLTVGMKHGTITVKTSGDLVEVTTFRTDGNYTDHRHPDTVSFVKDVTGDLSRRDFTINAIAVLASGEIVDPFGGQEDIRNGIVRCVGNPNLRFEEDALRMFRAFRFSSRLGFSIEAATFRAIRDNAHLASSLAAERIRDELGKVLMTGHPEAAAVIIDCSLLDAYLSGSCENTSDFHFLNLLPAEPCVRWAGLCHILDSSGCVPSVPDFLRSLRTDNRTMRCASEACILLAGPPIADAPGWKRALARSDEKSVRCAAEYWDAACGGGFSDGLSAVIASGDCCRISQLAVSGSDLRNLGYAGKDIGICLNRLLDAVIDRPELNRRDILLEIAKKANNYAEV